MITQESLNESLKDGDHMITFCRDKISIRPSETDSCYDYMEKLIFIPARRDRFLPGICLQKPTDSH